MALQLSQTKFGFTFANAYVRISSVMSSKAQGVNVNLQVFADSNAASASPALPLSGAMVHFDFSPDLTGTNPIANGYYLLKTLDEYSSATNV